MHGNFAAMEADLSLGPAPAVADAVSAAAMRRAGELPRVLKHHLLHRSDAGRQTETLERAVHILPSRFKAWKKRNPCRCGNLRHGVALLCGFRHPEPSGSRRATPALLFQPRAGQFLRLLLSACYPLL